MTNILKAIMTINPDARASVNADDINQIKWLEGTTPISKADIETKMLELQTEYDNLSYARKRAKSYPSMLEFIEAYTEKEIGGDTTKWDEYVVKYNKVRTDNPK
tara:strand:+ start:1118 stop:1429 length:312 start_codon:yes stop_codon:yes gene_type:complete